MAHATSPRTRRFSSRRVVPAGVALGAWLVLDGAIGCSVPTSDASCTGGCVGEPLPDPPMWRPAPVDQRRMGEPDEATEGMRPVAGSPQAATPGGEVVGINLDTDGPPARTLVQADGSFYLPIAVDAGQTLRLWVEVSGRRSLPLDLIALGSPSPYAAVTPNPCLQIPVELVVRSGDNPLIVNNQCATAATVRNLRVRMRSSGLGVSNTETSISPGAQTTLTLTVADAASADDTLLLDVDLDGATERRAVSLYMQ